MSVRGDLLAAGADIIIRGQSKPLDAFKVRTMNFGQPWRTAGIVDVAYEASIPIMCLGAVMYDQHADLIADCIAIPDDVRGAYELALRDRGWPSADVVLNDAQLCALALQHYAHDTLLQFESFIALDTRGELPYPWVLNTVTSADIRGGLAVVRGMARPPRPPGAVQFQDE